MKKINDVMTFVSGTPQFRIKEVTDTKAPLYTFYGQQDMEDDLVGISLDSAESKQVRTFDKVNTLSQGDNVFSLISGKASVVGVGNRGYLYTQNYVKLVVDDNVDSRYIVYLLNEDSFIKKQFQRGLQGSQVLKYTLKQLKELILPDLPNIETQRIIGEVYLNQLRLQALKNRVTNLETAIVLEKLKEGIDT